MKKRKYPGLVTTGDVAKILKMAHITVWRHDELLKPTFTKGGHRRYDLSKVLAVKYMLEHPAVNEFIDPLNDNTTA